MKPWCDPAPRRRRYCRGPAHFDGWSLLQYLHTQSRDSNFRSSVQLSHWLEHLIEAIVMITICFNSWYRARWPTSEHVKKLKNDSKLKNHYYYTIIQIMTVWWHVRTCTNPSCADNECKSWHLTCPSDDSSKVFHSFAVAELPLSQRCTVSVIVDPDGQVQGVRDGCPQVHWGPLLDQLCGVKDHAFLRVYSPARGHSLDLDKALWE